MPVKYEDWELLLNWRNDRLTRENSITSEEIDKCKHKEWLKVSINNANREIYIVTDNDEPVGTVRANREEWGYEISWTVAPNMRGKGYGKEMVKLLIDSLDGTIRAIVKESNIASQKIAQYAGLSFEKQQGDIIYFKIDK